MNTYDIAVIGGGAAGLSAALVLARARRRVAVIDDGRPRNAPAAHMQGFLSRDGMPPADLLAAGRTEVTGYGGEVIEGTVSGLTRSPHRLFEVLLTDGTTLLARRVPVTTGLSDRIPDIPGVAERWGRDLLHCPYCHGYEVRDRPLGVLGGTPGAVQHALLLRQWSPDVVFIAHTTRLTDSDRGRLTARAIGIVEGDVARLVVEDDRLRAVELADGRRVPRTAVFVRPEFVGNNTLVRGLGPGPTPAGHSSTSAASGRRATPRTRAHRSSPPPVRAPPPGSRSTTTSPRKTFRTPPRPSTPACPPEAAASGTHDPKREVSPMPDKNTRPVGPPTKHQLALMIWLCVFPTLALLNVTLAGWLNPMSTLLRTFVLATIAVPVVTLGLMPQLHRIRVSLLMSRSNS